MVKSLVPALVVAAAFGVLGCSSSSGDSPGGSDGTGGSLAGSGGSTTNSHTGGGSPGSSSGAGGSGKTSSSSASGSGGSASGSSTSGGGGKSGSGGASSSSSTGGSGGKTGSGGANSSSSTSGSSGKAGSGGGAGAGGASSGAGGASSGSGAGGASSGSGGVSSGSGGSSSTGSVTSSCGLPAHGSGGVSKPSSTAGNLKVVTWAGFKGAVSYTFDDANSSQVAHYSELEALGVHYTFFLIGQSIAANKSAWAQAVKDGHELGNHTQTHNSVTDSDVAQGQETIENDFGVKVYTMASPNGNTAYAPYAKTRYFLMRGVADGLMMPGDESGTDPFNTHCYIPATGAATSAFNGEIDSAISKGGWRVVLVHGFTGGTDSAYQPVGITDFVNGVKYAKGLDIWIDTYMNVGAYWRGQNAFQKATPTTSGGAQTWTWTLPDHFPPGKCLRVTVDGGTLQQEGKALEWDDHGYYEVSLDAGSLTLQ